MTKSPHEKTPDLSVDGGGTVFLLESRTDKGQQWIDEHVDPDAMRYAGSIVVEHRYITDIVDGARGDGLTVSTC